VCTFFARKALITIITSEIVTNAERGDLANFVVTYSKGMKAISVALLLTPAVLMYLNASVWWALLSSLTQAVSEIFLKFSVAKATKMLFRDELHFSILGKRATSAANAVTGNSLSSSAAKIMLEPGLDLEAMKGLSDTQVRFALVCAMGERASERTLPAFTLHVLRSLLTPAHTRPCS